MKDYDQGEEIPVSFTTSYNGQPFTLAGTPVMRVRAKGSNTDISSGVSAITVDGGNTGKHYGSIDTAYPSDYIQGTEYEVVLTAGTVNGISQAGRIIGEFRLRSNDEQRAKYASDFYWQALQNNMGEISDDITGALDSFSASTDDLYYNGHQLLLSNGKARMILDYDGDTLQPTYDRPTTFSVNQPYMTIPAPLPMTWASHVLTDVQAISGDTTAADNAEKFFDGTGYAGTNNVIPTVTTLTDKTGFSLSTAGILAIWHQATAAIVTAGSIGKQIVDNLNATITSRMASYTQPAGFLAATFPSGTIANTTNITDAQVTLKNGVTHGGNMAVFQFERLIGASLTSNEPAMKLTGNGNAPGLRSQGGATGHGVAFFGGATSGHGASFSASANGHGLELYSLGSNKSGLYASSDAGHGVTLVAQADGKAGLYLLSNGAGAYGMLVDCTGLSAIGVSVEDGVTFSSFTPNFVAGALDSVWSTSVRTLTSFGTLVADIWSYTTRILTAGTNIVLNKGTGITGLNDPTAAEVATATRTELATELGRIDAAVSSRAAPGDEMDLVDAPNATALDAIAQELEAHLLDEGDSQMLINAIVGAIGNINVDQVALVAAIRADLERNGGNLNTVITRLTADRAGYLDNLNGHVAQSGNSYPIVSSAIYGNAALKDIIDTKASQASVDDVPNNAEFIARTLPAADYFDWTTDVVARVTLVDTCTTNTDMRGTNGATTATPAQIAAATRAELATELARIDAAVSSRATPAEVNAELLDVFTVDTLIDGKSIQQALRIVAASTSGKLSGAGTDEEIFLGLDKTTPRLTVEADVSGNRTNVTYG